MPRGGDGKAGGPLVESRLATALLIIILGSIITLSAGAIGYLYVMKADASDVSTDIRRAERKAALDREAIKEKARDNERRIDGIVDALTISALNRCYGIEDEDEREECIRHVMEARRKTGIPCTGRGCHSPNK